MTNQLDFRQELGHVCLNFKFLEKFPIGLHMILQIQVEKSKLPNILCAKLFLPKRGWSATLHSS